MRDDDTVIDMPGQEVHLASAGDADVAIGRTDVRSVAGIAAAIGPCAPRNGVHSPLWIEGCARRMPKELWGVYPADVNH